MSRAPEHADPPSASPPSASQIEQWISDRIAELTGEPGDADGAEAGFTAAGLSSRDTVTLVGELQDYLGRPLAPTLAWDYPSVRALAQFLAQAAEPEDAVPQVTPADRTGPPATGSRFAEPPATGQVAVVGISCRYPGAPNPEVFWSLLEAGQDGLAVPTGRRQLGRPHGLLPGIDEFDAGLYSISDREASCLDPQQRLLLEASWQALEDAAIAPTSLRGSRTSVFVGISGSDYGRLQTAGPVPRDRSSGTGEAMSIAANRLSYLLDLRGISLAVDTACSSSLVAVHLAVRSLRCGESDLALAGGVSVLLTPEITGVLAQAGALAPDGRCKTFDAAADGYVRSEGCGIVVLKRLRDAIADGDRVLGVIAGSAVSQEGRTNGLTAPSGQAQQTVLRAALDDARMQPGDIGYVEAHGTGTALGDPIEVAALSAVYGPGTDPGRPLLLGSVKANIGHAEAAAGMAGLIKVLLMLANRRVPGQIHLRRLNPRLPQDARVRIPVTACDWPAGQGGTRAAGVSSFGFGGTIAHVIVTELAETAPATTGPITTRPATTGPARARPCHLLTLSAASQSSVTALAGRYASWLRDRPDADLGAMAATTTLGRAHLRHRGAVRARTHAEALAGLDALADGMPPAASAGAYHGYAGARPARLAMVFSGTGSQYLNMGRQLFVTSALFREELVRCQDLLADRLDVPLLAALFPLPGHLDLLDRPRYAQPAVVAVGYALARLWRSWGVVPDFVLGHSLGEFTAAAVSGRLGLPETLELVAERGALIEELCQPGAMAVVFASEDLVRDAAADLPRGRAPAVAAVNAPDAVVIAGPAPDVTGFLRELAERGVASRPLKAGHAFHSPMMRPAAAALRRTARGAVPADGDIAMVSGMDGRVLGTGQPDASYWARQLIEPVRFADGVALLVQQGCSQFLEVGPGRSLAAAGARAFPGALWSSSLRPGASDWSVLTDTVARLYTAGRDIDWVAFHGDGSRRRLALPGYPFERRRHWLPAPAASARAAEPPPGGDPDHDQPAAAGTERGMESAASDTLASAPGTAAPGALDPGAPDPGAPDPGAQGGTGQVLGTLARVVAGLLGTGSAVDPDMPFVELGADSMTLFQLLQTTQQAFGVSVSVGSLFGELNTLARLAEHVSAMAGSLTIDSRRHLDADSAVVTTTVVSTVAAEPGAVSTAVVRTETAGPGAGADGPGQDTGVGQFLQVHARVMSQAYELLRGTPSGSGNTDPARQGVLVPATAGTPGPATAGAAGPEPTVPVRPSGPARPTAPAGIVAAGGLAASEAFVPFRTDGPVNGGLVSAQRAFAQELMRRYTARTRRSRRLADAERPRHADARHAFLAFPDLKPMMYPVSVDRSLGARSWDIDGNEYLDLAMGYGVNLFGHQEPFIISAITEQLSRGIQLGPHSPLAAEVAQLLSEMTGQQRVLFCNTGSEAVMVAVRLARAVTGRRRIALFAGSYHGSADPVLARQDLSRRGGDAVPLAPGVTDDIGRNVLVLPYGDDAALEALRAHRDELAGVLVEPVQSRRPDLQPAGFLRELRELTTAAGVPLIFDEIITGFRMHPGGAAALFGITADLTTYGKVLGGGLPIGVVAGDARYLDAIDGGSWRPGTTASGDSVRTFFTGTFAKHPLALAAARAVLTELGRHGPGLQEGLGARTEDMARRLDAAFHAAGVAARIGRFGSLFRFQFPAEPAWSRPVELFYAGLVEKGLYVWEGRNCFLSTAHTEADIDQIVSAVAGTAAEMAEAGFFSAGRRTAVPDSNGSGPPEATDGWPLSQVQRDIWAADQEGADRSRAYTEGLLLDLRGELDLAALRAATAEALGRHDSLHAVIAADGSRQLLVPARAHLPLIDLTGGDDRKRRRRLAAWLDAQAGEVLDVTAEPPVRAAVLRLAADHHQLYLAAHHIVIDGRSFDIILSQLAELYARRRRADQAPLPEPVQYAEHVAWQRRYRESAAGQDSLRYWREHYSAGVPAPVVPRGPGAARAGRALGVVQRAVSGELAGQLATAASALGVTAFTVLLAAYGGMLHRLTGRDDLVIGVPFAGRGYQGGDTVVGHCATMLPVRSRLRPPQRGRDYLSAMQATLLAAYEHPEFSPSVLPEPDQTGDNEGWGIFSAQLNLDRLSPLRAPGLRLRVCPLHKRHARAGLIFDLLLADDGLTLTAEYDATVFDQAAVTAHADTFERLLQLLISDPDAVLLDRAMEGA